MRRVWKYVLRLNDDDQCFCLPANARVRHVEDLGRELCLWAEVDDISWLYEDRKFRVFGTGHEVPDGYDWVGTAVMEPYVWHVFEKQVEGHVLRKAEG